MNIQKDDGLTDKIEIPSHQGGLLLEKQNGDKNKEKDNATHIVSVVEQGLFFLFFFSKYFFLKILMHFLKTISYRIASRWIFIKEKKAQ